MVNFLRYSVWKLGCSKPKSIDKQHFKTKVHEKANSNLIFAELSQMFCENWLKLNKKVQIVT